MPQRQSQTRPNKLRVLLAGDTHSSYLSNLVSWSLTWSVYSAGRLIDVSYATVRLSIALLRLERRRTLAFSETEIGATHLYWRLRSKRLDPIGASVYGRPECGGLRRGRAAPAKGQIAQNVHLRATSQTVPGLEPIST